MNIELKIKSKHLALEPSIVKKEENKLKLQIKYYRDKQEYFEAAKLEYKLQKLINHRKIVIRRESRATYLARAFLAGKSYIEIEKHTKQKNNIMHIFNRVYSMVCKYGNGSCSKTSLYSWLLEK